MNKGLILVAVLMLCALLFTGCRKDSSSKAKTMPATSATTQTTMILSPEITLPMDTTGVARGHR